MVERSREIERDQTSHGRWPRLPEFSKLLQLLFYCKLFYIKAFREGLPTIFGYLQQANKEQETTATPTTSIDNNNNNNNNNNHWQ